MAEDAIEQLEQAIAALESQRAILGSAITDTALAPLKEKLAALKQQSIGEQRKMVSVLFADLVGFTSMAEKMEPEDVREVLEAYFALWRFAIQRHNGLIEKYIGDAVMVVYGLSAVQEDDAERAIRTALQMCQELEALNRQMEAAHDLRLVMRIGIHSGLALVSVLDGAQAREYLAVGDTVNLASRLQAAAPENGILISHETYRQVKGTFDVQALDPVHVKGKEKPVQVYLVLQAKPRAFRTATRGVEGVETRMVGRQSELHYLQDEFSFVVEQRRCRVVTLFGEAGIGKSRLLYEFEDWLELHPQRMFYFRGRAYPSTQTAPYSLLRYLFAFRFQIQDSDSMQTVREKLEGGLSAAWQEAETGRMKAHIIGHVLGFSIGDSPYLGESQPSGMAAVTARQYSERALLYLREYFQELAAQRPLVALLEDIHWADRSSLDLLEQLVHRLASQAIFILCAARPALLDHRPDWGQGAANYFRLDLKPLSKSESQQLVEEILKQAQEIPEYLGELVVENADGNPFYIEELLKMLIEDGVIQTGGEPWAIRPERLEGLRVPPTLAGVLQARFDGLSREERRLLKSASVIGRTFWDRAVAFLNQPSGAVDVNTPPGVQDLEILAGLRRREMIYQRVDPSFEGTREFFFKHALLRDVAYESLLKRQRWIYHALAAGWLESITERSRRQDEYAALIASHYEQANKQERAAVWYRRAGETAAAQYANAEAIHHLTRALNLVPQHEAALRFELLLLRESVNERLGDRRQQAEDLQALAAIAENLDDDLRRCDVALRRAALAFYNGNYAEMETDARQALTLASKSRDAVRETGCHLSLGRALTWLGMPSQAVTELEFSLSEARRLHLPLETECLWNLAVVNNNLGEYERALDCAEQALSLYQSAGDFSGLSAIYSQMGAIYSNHGNRQKARDFFSRHWRSASSSVIAFGLE